MREAFALHEIILDPDGKPVDYRFLEVNPAFTAMTGLEPGKLIGKTVKEMLPGTEQHWIERYGRIALGGGNDRFESYSGAIGKWFDVSVFQAGRGRFATIFTDISEQKKTNNELLHNEARLQSLVRLLDFSPRDNQELLDVALAEAIALTASKYGYIYKYDEASQEFTLNSWSGKVMGDCRVEEQKTLYQLSKTGFWGEAVRQRKTIIDNDYASPSPLKRGFPPGHVKFSRFLTVPILQSQSIVGVVGVADKAAPYDEADARQLELLITPIFARIGRLQAERSAMESESRFGAIVHAIDAIVFTLDTAGRHTGVYGSWLKSVEGGAQAFLGKTYRDVFGPEASAVHGECLETALKGNQVAYEWSLPAKGRPGRTYYQTVLSPIYVQGTVTGVVGVGHDITEHVVAREDLENLVREKMLLVQEVHHRVKNNLQMIISMMELQCALIEDRDFYHRMKTMQSRIYSISSVHELLGGTGSPERISLADHLARLVSFFKSMESDIPGRSRPAPFFDIVLEADTRIQLPVDVAVPLSLIVHELVMNSLRHARQEDGRLRIAVSADQVGGESCRLAIEDNGTGGAEDPGQAQAGMGTMLIEGLTEQIRGTLTVERTPGYRVEILFPLAGAGSLQRPNA